MNRILEFLVNRTSWLTLAIQVVIAAIALAVCCVVMKVVAANEPSQPKVQWLDSPVTVRYKDGQPLGIQSGHWWVDQEYVNFDVEMGLREDGVVVWRKCQYP